MAIARHDLVQADDGLVGATERVERARQDVVEALDRAQEAGVAEAELDAVIAACRRERLSTIGVLLAVARVALERAGTALHRGKDVSDVHLAWATTEELARALGVTSGDVQPLIDHARETGLVFAVHETALYAPPLDQYEQMGWALTPAGERSVQAGDLRSQPRSRPRDQRWPELGG
jgi:hypothetical protein